MENFTPLKRMRTIDTLNDFLRNLGKPDKTKKVVNFDKDRKPFEVGKHRQIRSQLNTDEYCHFQRIQNQPYRQYFADTLPPIVKIPKAKKEIKPTLRKKIPKIESGLQESPVPLDTLIRRPTVIRSKPLRESDEYFQYLISFPALKPLTFDENPSRNIVFYLENYPLLLKNPHLQGPATIMVNKRRVRSPELLLQRHREAMDIKQQEMDKKIRQLEKESGEFFVSVLRSKVFEPQSWEWNKLKAKLLNPKK